MCNESPPPTLLVLLPGGVSRSDILRRLDSACSIVIACPTDVAQSRSAWSRAIVEDSRFIEWDGGVEDPEPAWRAVQQWLEEVPSRSIGGVMTYDDYGIRLAADLAARMNLPSTPVEEIECLRNKSRFRERCRSAGVPAVRSVLLDLNRDLEELLALPGAGWPFPSVLKPARGAGSYHVLKVSDWEEFRVAITEFRANLLNGSLLTRAALDEGFILEEYFGGHEVDIDGWARNGKVEFCLVSDNVPAVEPYFLELGGIYPSQLPAPAVEALERLTRDVVGAFRGVHGVFHFEARVNVDSLEVMPIEFNARCGGAECPLAVEAVSGYFLPEVAARLALGQPVSPSVARSDRKHAVVASRNIHLPEGGTLTECSTDGVASAGDSVLLNVLLRQPGQHYEPNRGSASCLAILATGGRTAEEAEANMLAAMGGVRIAVAAAH